jgi:F-type H+-transporting ATPase subunit b
VLVHTVTVTMNGAGGLRVFVPRQETTTVPATEGETTETTVAGAEGEQHAETTQPEEGPSPIAPEFKELLWGFGAFFVFLVLMRLFLVPKMKQGMQARYGKVRSDLETADALKLSAEQEVAEYQAALAEVRAEAASRIDAARQTLESERQARLAEVNARISDRRAAAVAEAEQAKAAARGTIEAAVGDVAARASELAIGRSPDYATVHRAVTDAMSAGVGS